MIERLLDALREYLAAPTGTDRERETLGEVIAAFDAIEEGRVE